METHQKDIEEKDPFGQNGADEAEAEAEADDDEKSFLKALLAERALNNQSHKLAFWIKYISSKRKLTDFISKGEKSQ